MHCNDDDKKWILHVTMLGQTNVFSVYLTWPWFIFAAESEIGLVQEQIQDRGLARRAAMMQPLCLNWILTMKLLTRKKSLKLTMNNWILMKSNLDLEIL
jgi:hypothetical protein